MWENTKRNYHSTEDVVFGRYELVLKNIMSDGIFSNKQHSNERIIGELWNVLVEWNFVSQLAAIYYMYLYFAHVEVFSFLTAVSFCAVTECTYYLSDVAEL